MNQNLIADELIQWASEASSELESEGFVFCRKIAPHLLTQDIAALVGSILEIDKLLPFSRIPPVQTLVPRTADQASEN